MNHREFAHRAIQANRVCRSHYRSWLSVTSDNIHVYARYYGVSGEDQLFVLHSKHTLQPETWTHVAVVQTKSRYNVTSNSVQRTSPILLCE